MTLIIVVFFSWLIGFGAITPVWSIEQVCSESTSTASAECRLTSRFMVTLPVFYADIVVNGKTNP